MKYNYNSLFTEWGSIELEVITGTRKGMINVSPIGRACSQTERDAFEQHDKTANVRPKMVEHLKVSPTNISRSLTMI